MVTMIVEDTEVSVAGAQATGDDLWLSAVDAETVTGWVRKPEGLCRAEVCVPLPPRREAELVDGSRVNVAGLWRLLGRPVVHGARGDAWVLGASARDRAAALQSLEAPDFSLPDVAGRLRSLSEHRGKKVLLVTWASW